jgi:hypothetical protein
MKLAPFSPVFALTLAPAAAAQVTFSIDFKGPTVATPDCLGGVPITEGDILMPCTATGNPAFGPLPPPRIAITGGFGGLGIATHAGCVGHPPGTPCPIEVDALSYSLDGPAMPNLLPGAFKFSVTQYATGMPSPVPPSVFSESPAPIGEAASDVFVSLMPLPFPGCAIGLIGGNTAMIDGNGLAGPSPFAYPGLGLAEPNTRAFGPFCALPDAGDNLDGLDVDGPIGPVVYFSLDGLMPDVCGFPGSGTGPANGFPPGAVLVKLPAAVLPAVYAPPAVLGLDLLGPGTDDLDALALYENGVPGYQPSPGPFLWFPMAMPDMLLFSVSATSAVVGLPDSACGAPISPGDILIPPIPGGLSPFPAIYIAAENLGLSTFRIGGPTNDDLDALDVTRVPVQDCNGNGIEDAVDIAFGAPDCNGNRVIDTCESSISTYCTPATTSNGCNATMSWAGTPTASLSCPFNVSVNNVEGAKQGLIFYGVSGPTAAPWGTGFLCVKAPTQRTPAQFSGGTAGACDGTLTLDFNAYMTANPLALGQPLYAGEPFWMQAWFRDPPSPKTTNFSDALTFTLAP